MDEVNAFTGCKERPSNAALERALGAAMPLWHAVLERLASACDIVEWQWKSYSPKAGWSLLLFRANRVIVYLIPYSGRFQVAFVLGGKALAAARQRGISARLEALLAEAPTYAEGTGVRFEFAGPDDLDLVEELTRIKLSR